MSTDVTLSVLHFLLVLSLVALLAAEWALVQPGRVDEALPTIGKIDGAYGAASVLLLLAGFARVSWGMKDSAFYFDNPVFWAKIALFLAIGLASLPPTLAFINWRRARQANAAFVVPADALRRVRVWLHIEAGLLVLVIFAAALMARGIGA
jgi:putative membrane protein